MTPCARDASVQVEVPTPFIKVAKPSSFGPLLRSLLLVLSGSLVPLSATPAQSQSPPVLDSDGNAVGITDQVRTGRREADQAVGSHATLRKIGLDGRNIGTAGPDFQIGRFAAFRTVLTDADFALQSVSTFEASDLLELDLLIMTIRSDSAGRDLTASEIAAIHAFVDVGGALIFISDAGFSSDDYIGNSNSLLFPYGISMAASASDPNGRTVTSFVAHPVTAGLSSVGVDFQRSLTVTPPGLDLTSGSGLDRIMAAIDGVATSGNVVVFSDASMFSTGSVPDTPITFGDNELALSNAVAFVAPPLVDTPTLSEWGRIVFLLSLFGAGAITLTRKKVPRA